MERMFNAKVTLQTNADEQTIIEYVIEAGSYVDAMREAMYETNKRFQPKNYPIKEVIIKEDQ